MHGPGVSKAARWLNGQWNKEKTMESAQLGVVDSL